MMKVISALRGRLLVVAAILGSLAVGYVTFVVAPPEFRLLIAAGTCCVLMGLSLWWISVWNARSRERLKAAWKKFLEFVWLGID